MKTKKCDSCGYLFPKGNLVRVDISIGTFDNPEAARMWLCHDCDPDNKHDDRS